MKQPPPQSLSKSRATSKKDAPASAAAGAPADPEVVAFLRERDHPLEREIQAVREVILGAAPGIREGIKWKAPSSRTTDHFATFNLRARDRALLIFHTGAKAKATAVTGVKIADPTGRLEWLAKDRCVVTFRAGDDVAARRPTLESIVREWVRHV